jgi:streptomycin 6-kinase
LNVPGRLAANCRKMPERAAWLDRLPVALRDLDAPMVTDGRRAVRRRGRELRWVAPVAVAGGTCAVLKLGMPHMEAEHEPKVCASGTETRRCDSLRPTMSLVPCS